MDLDTWRQDWNKTGRWWGMMRVIPPFLRQNERGREECSKGGTRLAETNYMRRNESSKSGPALFRGSSTAKRWWPSPSLEQSAFWGMREDAFSAEGTPGFFLYPVAYRKSYCLNRSKSLLGIHIMKGDLQERLPANTVWRGFALFYSGLHVWYCLCPNWWN